MKPLLYVALAGTIGLAAACTATAQGGPQGGPPTDEIAAALGITTAEFETCAPGAPPEQGGRPSQEDMEAMQAELVSCVQGFDSSLTAADVQQVMEQFRPEPPQRG